MMSDPSIRFDYSEAIRRLCEDVVLRLPAFSHIKMDQIGISIRTTRNRKQFGTFASVVPLRFENGTDFIMKRGVRWVCQKFVNKQGTDLLYILSIYLQRFQDLPLLDKMSTILHELYHISEKFDGDIRRFNGRCYAHGSSRKEYDRQMAVYVQDWLRRDPPPELWEFLKLDFNELRTAYKKIVYSVYSVPRLIKDPNQ
ncbi:MAG: putative metallopeptidase [Planctomycetia bacterium]|nr:putative metallopeptidase [Planctomycetia bacterium]